MISPKVSISKWTFLILFCLIATISEAAAAVTVNDRSHGAAFDNAGVSTATVTFPHSINAGTKRALYVTVSATSVIPCTVLIPNCDPPLPPLTLPMGGRITGVTYNGIAMTKLREDAGTETSIAVFRLLSAQLPAAAGSYDVVVNTAGSSNVVGNAVSFNGVSQTATPAFSANNGNSNAPTVTVNGSVAGDMVLDILGSTPNAGTFTAGINQIVCQDDLSETTCSRGRSNFNNIYDVGASSTKAGNTGSVPMTWTMTIAQPWLMLATNINQDVSTAAGVSLSGRVVSMNKGIARARVTLIDSNGGRRTAMTNFYGFYRFENVRAGETYVLNVESRWKSFEPQTIAVNEDISGLNFAAQ